MRNILKKIILMLIALTFSAVLIIISINIHMVGFSDEFIHNSATSLNEEITGTKQAVIVFGAYVYDNGLPCPMLEDRLHTGIEVYELNISEKVLLSGDHGSRGYDEVNSMKDFVFDKGLVQSDVFLDHAGFSTYESVIRAADIFNVESAVLSTQHYHLTRAVYIARKYGIEAYGVMADRRNYPKSEMTRYLIREWFARVKDFLYINILKPDPTYSGEKIPISGDSRNSYDKPDDLQ